MRSTWHKKLEVALYHPNSNGLVERVNSKILKIIKIYCAEHDTDNWDVFLHDCMAAINATISRSIGETPFYLLFKFNKRDLYDGKNDIEKKKSTIMMIISKYQKATQELSTAILEVTCKKK